MKEELISVIIPVYNCEQYLAECINSILNQTYQNLEIMIVNDGSTDNTLSICEEYKKIDSRISIVNKKNTGVSDTRNIGVQNANGKYILFVDADDYLKNNMIERLYKSMIENKADVVRCKCCSIKDNNVIKKESLHNLTNKKIVKEEINKIIGNFVTNENTIACYVGTMLIKRDRYVMFNTNLTFMEDTEFFIRLLFNINSIYFLDEELYYYRYNENSASKSPNRCFENIYGLIDSTNIIKEFLFENTIIDNKFLKKINNNIFNLIFSKLKIYVEGLNIIEKSKSIRNLFLDDNIKNILNNLEYSELSKIKNIELKLIKKNKFIFLTVVIKFTKLKDRI